MRVMVMVKATANSEAGLMPGTDLLESMGKFNAALAEAGILVGGDGLKPSAVGKRVVFDHGRHTVYDGPFAETKELVAGYWVWNVASMEEAVEWVKRCPDPMPGEVSEIEIRPFYEAEDFGEQFTPEMRAEAERIYAQVSRRADDTSAT